MEEAEKAHPETLTRRELTKRASRAALLTAGLSPATPSPNPKSKIQNPKSPPRSVRSVENGGLLFTDNPAGVSGVDAGYSLPLGAQTIWLFGDVFLLDPSKPTRPYVGGVSNCALLVPHGRGPAPLRRFRFLTDPKTGLARPAIPNAPGEGDETRLWPFGGWHDAATRTAYLYYGLVRTTGEGGPFGFRTVGQGLARANVSRPASLRFERVGGPGGGVWWPSSGAVFGSAVVSGVPARDMYLYVVGYEERDRRKFGKLARVPRGRIADPRAYEYYAGTPAAPQWSLDPARAADVDGLNDFPSELSVAFNPYLGGYLAVHSVLIEPRIRLSLAPAPWGPYTRLADIGAPHRAFEKAFCYAGKEHAELAEAGGRVLYVTYVDSQRYWLQLLKVTLDRGPTRGAGR